MLNTRIRVYFCFMQSPVKHLFPAILEAWLVLPEQRCYRIQLELSQASSCGEGYISHHICCALSPLSTLQSIFSGVSFGQMGQFTFLKKGVFISDGFFCQLMFFSPFEVVGKPFSIISFFSHRWVFGWMGCRWYGWAGFFFGCGSLITMTAVSLDRYLKICHLSYGKKENYVN